MPKRVPNVLRSAYAAIGAGWAILPLRPREKKPAIKEWQKQAFRDVRSARRYFAKHPNANFGIITGAASGIVVIDIDGPQGEKSLRKLINKYGKLPKTVRGETPNGQHIYLEHPGGQVKNSAGKLATGIDVRGDGGYVVGAGSLHPEGGRYRYKPGRALGEVKIARMPSWLIDSIASPKPSHKLGSAAGAFRIDPKRRKSAKTYLKRVQALEYERLEKAPMHQRNDTLNRCAFKLGQLLCYHGFDRNTVTADLSRIAKTIGLEDHEIPATIQSGLTAGAARPRKIPFVKDHGGAVGKTSRPKLAQAKDLLTQELARLSKNDVDNAKRFVARFGLRALHSPGLGWFIFDGRVWQPDELKMRIRWAIETARRIADEAKFLRPKVATARRKFSFGSRNKGALERMLDLAAPSLFVKHSAFDASPDLLCVKNGTIDLRSGKLEPHDPRDLVTKLVEIDYDGAAAAPLFAKFLKDATGHNKELAEYVQLAVGYTLTGHVREKVFFFLYGPKDSGKSSLIRLITQILGVYAHALSTASLTTKQHDGQIPNDLAGLRGARFVAASEAHFNRQLDEVKIKQMTGGDEIAARFLYHEWFKFKPIFKLWIMANEYPRVRSSDSAFWQRARVVPFGYTVKEEQMDKDLARKLTAELPGILAWAVAGARQWYKTGLGTAAVVQDAIRHWKDTAEIVKRFYQECCSLTPGERVPTGMMYARFEKWCADNGEETISIKELKGRLVELDITPGRTSDERFWRDVRLIK